MAAQHSFQASACEWAVDRVPGAPVVMAIKCQGVGQLPIKGATVGCSIGIASIERRSFAWRGASDLSDVHRELALAAVVGVCVRSAEVKLLSRTRLVDGPYEIKRSVLFLRPLLCFQPVFRRPGELFVEPAMHPH